MQLNQNLTKAQEQKLEHDKAFKKIHAAYQRDPAYWFDLLVKNWKKPALREECIKTLWDLGWNVEKHQ